MDENKLNRIEAAAWLTEHGRPTRPQALANMAGRKTGPKYDRDGRTVVYAVADLTEWMTSGGDGRRHPRIARTNGHDAASNAAREVHARVIETSTRNPGGDPLLVRGFAGEIISEFLTVADRMLDGGGTFADGVAYARGLEKLRRLVGG